MQQLPVLQKTYDFVKHYVPIISRLPKQHKYALGERLTINLYTLLEGLIQAQYEREKLSQLQSLNTQLEIIRYQTRLLHDFDLINAQRYEHIAKLINEIGNDLGGWIRQQRGRQSNNNKPTIATVAAPQT
jgi:23S rRNA-intervening sequence protein